MKFICTKSELEQAISIVQKAVKSNSTKPILDGILIQASNNKVMLTGYDLETGIEADVDSDVFEAGAVVANSKIFGEIIRKLPEESITIKSNDKNKLTIESGVAEFNINGNSADEYPKIPVIDNNDKIIMPQAVLKRMINNVIFAVSRDDTRPALTGCLLESDGKYATMVALDGFRMAVRKEELGDDFPLMNFLIPGKALSESAKIFDGKNEEEVIIYSSNNHLLFDIGNVRVVSRLIIQPYVNYSSLIQNSAKTVMNINRKLLLDAIERASLIIMNEERRFPVQVSMSDNETIVISANTDAGNLKEEISASISGDLIDIDFNARFFIDALKNIDDEMIKIEFNGALGPCIVRPIEGEAYVYLILPIRR